MDSNQHSLILRLEAFDNYGFPKILGPHATLIAKSLIIKSAKLYFPQSFQMTNTELSNITGIPICNIGRYRQKVLDFCNIDGSPLFHYRKGEIRNCGRYWINFELFSTYFQDVFKLFSETPVFENNLKSLYNKEYIENSSNGGIENATTVEEDEVSNNDDLIWISNQIAKIAPGWMPHSEFMKQQLLDIVNIYDRKKIETVIQNAGMKGVSRNAVLGYLQKGLDNYDKYYNGAGDEKHYDTGDQIIQRHNEEMKEVFARLGIENEPRKSTTK